MRGRGAGYHPDPSQPEPFAGLPQFTGLRRRRRGGQAVGDVGPFHPVVHGRFGDPKSYAIWVHGITRLRASATT